MFPREPRWWTYMQDFQFVIQYRKEKSISHVDFLSRNPVHSPTLTLEVNYIHNSTSMLETAQQNAPHLQFLIEKLQNRDINEKITCFAINFNQMLIESLSFLNVAELVYWDDDELYVKYAKIFSSSCLLLLKNICVTVWYVSNGRPLRVLNNVFLHSIEKAFVLFQTVHLDCTGPFAQSNEGFRDMCYCW